MSGTGHSRRTEPTLTDEAKHPDFVTALRAERIVAILRRADAAQAVAGGTELVAAGIRILEVSLNTRGALDAIARLAASVADRPEVVVGAGTVLHADDVRRAADAGARFFVAPVLDVAAVRVAGELGMAAIPGCATPTEMLRAHEAGADAVKVFPATLWTPAGLANVARALPYLRLVPTGGIGIDDAADWLRAGAAALGMGSTLFDAPDSVHRLKAAVSEYSEAAVS
jgi:2-dehydro-3-deoxyphosphogluconate aldolase/(4S)-4-hydroxy-2-oxoglutarate aldolase